MNSKRQSISYLSTQSEISREDSKYNEFECIDVQNKDPVMQDKIKLKLIW